MTTPTKSRPSASPPPCKQLRQGPQMTIESSLSNLSRRLKEIIGLESEPVAVYLVAISDENRPAVGAFTRAPGHRYCQLLMRARRGESVQLTAEDIACPAAAAAFGWRLLPEGLATGKGLVGFGIVSKPATGRRMFEGMPQFAQGAVSIIAACPLSLAPAIPDVVVVEGSPEQLMWLLLADLNVADGQRRRADTAVLQATCVDATIIPHLEHRMNFSLGCYGCREATDLGPGETVIGFPGAAIDSIVAALECLSEKAIGRSRAKVVLENLARGKSTARAGDPSFHDPSATNIDPPKKGRTDVD